VLPAVFERLPQVFPEFGWRRDAHGWVATNYQHTKARFGVRADRVVAHALPLPPRGLYIHGEDRVVLWTEYINGGTVPKGADFIRAVKEIAERAGVDASPLERPQPRDRRADLLQAFFDHCQRELASDHGAKARAYLEHRGFPRDAIDESRLGLVPAAGSTRHALEGAGYGEAEIETSGVLADSRWPGRLCGAWRDDYGRIGTLWARTLDKAEDAGSRYLYLRGAARTNLPPYGLRDALPRDRGAPRELVLVEGLIDVHQLRARGIENVAALGGTAMRARAFERLHRRGIETVTLCLDNDDAGRVATGRAIEQSARAQESPVLHVVDPARLAPAKDPDQLVRERGAGAWHELLATRTCGIEWRARDLAAGVSRESPGAERRAALGRAGRWLGTLPPRLALEQEDALRTVAAACGYSVPAVRRAFQTQFFREQTIERAKAVRASERRPVERAIER
jgi:DNA primase